jgi:soluble lytic murein transglycosylase
MIKGKTLKKLLVCIIITFLISNHSYARLIKPEPKPSEYKKDIPKKTKKASGKVKPEVLTLKEPAKIKRVAPIQKTKQKKEVKKEITKVKIETKNEKYVVSNEIIPLKKPLNLGISKKKSSILSSKDFLIAQRTFGLIKRKRWNSAMKEVRKSRSKLLNELVIWMYLKEPSNNLAFKDYRKFINQNPEWPRINRLRYLAEHKINFKEVKPKEVIKFFDKQDPLSGYGKIKLGEAFLTRGEKNKAHDLIADGFKTANLSSIEHRYLNKKFRNLLTKEDYIERAKYLAWEQDFYELRRTIRYLPSGYKELYFARFALMTRSYGVDSAIAKVPAQFKNDIGLQFDRAKWRRKRGRYDSTLEIINNLPRDPKLLVKPDLWFKEKFIIARSRINKKRFEEAYELLINHGVLDSGNLAKAEWHAGWLALRFLNKPGAAVQHFKTMYDGVNYPISKSRAAYWVGKAYEQLGKDQNAKDWYKKSSVFNTTFYGQLASAKINKKDFKVKNNYTFSQEDYKKLLKTDLARAVILLDELDMSLKSKDILRHLGSEERSIKEQVLSGKLSQQVGRLDFAIQIAKQTSYQNKNLLELNYPIIETPKVVSKRTILPQEVILSLIRQESEFDRDANSWVGAKGLMQIMPATGRLVSKQAGLRYSRSRLIEDEFFNLQLGSYYISGLNDEFNGAIYMAFAGYNAGPHRVRRWVKRFGDPRKGEIDPIDWIELIPFTETRNYVQRVIENIQVYKYVINKKTVTNNIEKMLF